MREKHLMLSGVPHMFLARSLIMPVTAVGWSLSWRSIHHKRPAHTHPQFCTLFEARQYQSRMMWNAHTLGQIGLNQAWLAPVCNQRIWQGVVKAMKR